MKKRLDRSQGSGLRGLGFLLALAAAVLVSAGCARGYGVSNPFEEDAAGPQSLRLFVDNLNFADATLYALGNGGRSRIGSIAGKQRNTFTVPWQTYQEFRVEIDLLAGDRYVTNSVSVGPGDEVQLVIQDPLRGSFLRR